MIGSNDLILVTSDDLENDDPYAIIQSNIDAVNYFYDHGVEPSKIAAAALHSYYVDFYHSEVHNGGHSQFIWNSRWEAIAIFYLRQGLTEMGAVKHLEIFDECAEYIKSLNQRDLEKYLANPYTAISRLAELDDRYYKIKDDEGLIAVNSRWLKTHPLLTAYSREEWQAKLKSRISERNQ